MAWKTLDVSLGKARAGHVAVRIPADVAADLDCTFATAQF